MSTDDNSPEGKRVSSIRHRAKKIWPWAFIALGVALTAAWIFVLIYGVIRLVENAI
jgi:hypothetical protein